MELQSGAIGLEDDIVTQLLLSRGVEREDLEEFGVTLPEIAEGAIAGPLPGKQGVHLVYRPPGKP